LPASFSSAACHTGTADPPYSSNKKEIQRPAPTEERQIKTQKPFLSAVFCILLLKYAVGGQRIKFHSVSKIITIKGMVRQILNRAAVHV
jgi:hypothetical protein